MDFIYSNSLRIFQIVFIGSLAYLTLIIILRIFGKRVLAKMNAFDFLVTVALGSILATTVVSKDLAYFEGMVAFLLLIVLQFILAKLTMYSKRVNYLVKSRPTALFYKGKFDYEQMRKERVLEEEIYQAVRAKGIASLNEVLAVVLETTGDISVLSRSSEYPGESTLKNVSIEHFAKEIQKEK